MAQTITINTVGNALGQYCVQYSPQITMDLKEDLELDVMLPKISCDNFYQGQDLDHSTVLQPYQKEFTPNNESNWGGYLNGFRFRGSNHRRLFRFAAGDP